MLCPSQSHVYGCQFDRSRLYVDVCQTQPTFFSRVTVAWQSHVMMPPAHLVPLAAPSCDKQRVRVIGKMKEVQEVKVFFFFFFRIFFSSAVISPTKNINSSVSCRGRPTTAAAVGERACKG